MSDGDVRHEKTRLLRRRVSSIFSLVIYTGIPPPFSAGKIMTTTTTRVITERRTLLIVLFNMEKYYFVNILPPILKTKNFFNSN
jgi:hypothetical protein